MSTRAVEILDEARVILTGQPFAFLTVTVDFPGVLIVTIDNGDGSERAYVTGLANATYTVEYYRDDRRMEAGEQPDRVGDTCLPVAEGDGYRLAIQFAATIDRMEAEGDEVLANGCPECERSHGPHYRGPCTH